MGLLLQAPCESNQFRRTLKAILRWLGSPISSIAYILWNIKVLGKCASMVDMAVSTRVAYNSELPFAKIRDSFYILSLMNQFKIHSILPDDSPAEMLIRIALFSESLVMPHGAKALSASRTELASELRSLRRRGSEPVFISLLWFLAALVFSIYLAFGNLGVRAIALNLAMELMLSWMPVFVLACIVDRNPYNTKKVRTLLNTFVVSVAEAVRDGPTTCFMEYKPEYAELRWVSKLQEHLQRDEDKLDGQKTFRTFSTAFAGQGRTSWPYGIAHSILVDIEDSVVRTSGRVWFSNDDLVLDSIIIGPDRCPTGFHYLNPGEFWQATQAFMIVEGTLAGAFTLAYCTPTYGLGCRSGGFMILMILTFFSFVLEIFCGWDIDRQYHGIEADHVDPSNESRRDERLSRLKLICREPVFVILDLTIAGWLFYIVWAQTVGAWEPCNCVASTWV